MPSCVLHVVGENFDPAPVVAKLSLKPYAIFRKGDKRFPDNPRSEKLHSNGGFKCLASNVDGDLEGQAKDAIVFLTEYYEDLWRLCAEKTIQRKCLDFGYLCRLDYDRPAEEQKCFAQFDHLPVELPKLCGDLEIGIELSLYPHSTTG